MTNTELKVGDKVKAGSRKPAGLPRKYTEGVIVGFGFNNVTIKFLENGEEKLRVVSKNQCTLIEAA